MDTLSKLEMNRESGERKLGIHYWPLRSSINSSPTCVQAAIVWDFAC